MDTYTTEQINNAYEKGWEDGYDDNQYNNPFDEVTEKDSWLQYDNGFGDGTNEG